MCIRDRTHAEFVRIHPFPDGNGRTSRLIMNYQLLANGFPAVSIAKENLSLIHISGDTLKSGYGIQETVTAGVSTNQSHAVTEAQNSIKMCIRDRGGSDCPAGHGAAV